MATVKTEKEKAQPKAKAAASNGPLMYVGPTLRTIPLSRTVYTEIPKEAQEAFAEHPQLRILFVPILRYPEVETQMQRRTGAYFAAYHAVIGL